MSDSLKLRYNVRYIFHLVSASQTKNILVFKIVSFQTLCERLAFGGQSRDEHSLITQGVF